MVSAEPRIDPHSLQIIGWPDGRLSESEFAALERPPCPVCGTRVDVQQIDVSCSTDYPERMFVQGRWSCPNLCNPRTGERGPPRGTYLDD